LLGSLLRGRRQIEVVFDSDLAPDAVVAFYREQLAALGWRMPEESTRGGFTHGSATQSVTFCRSARGPALFIDATAAAVTQVRLTLRVDERRRCGRSGQSDLFARIPPLTPPAGDQQRAMGGSGGDDSVYMTGLLTTDRVMQEIADHYQAQLARAGWVRHAASTTESTTVITYTITDEDGLPWRGSLFLLQRPGSLREYLLLVWLEADEGATVPDGGWAAWSRRS
jgi:hypothetical protein